MEFVFEEFFYSKESNLRFMKVDNLDFKEYNLDLEKIINILSNYAEKIEEMIKFNSQLEFSLLVDKIEIKILTYDNWIIIESIKKGSD